MSLRKFGNRVLAVFTGIGIILLAGLVLWIYLEASEGKWGSGFAVILYLVIIAGLSLIIFGFPKDDKKKKEEIPAEKKE